MKSIEVVCFIKDQMIGKHCFNAWYTPRIFGKTSQTQFYYMNYTRLMEG